MSVADKINSFFMKNIALRMMRKIENHEDQVFKLENSHKFADNSPYRFDILQNAANHELGPKMMHIKSLPATISSMKYMGKAIKSTNNNPVNPLKTIPGKLLDELVQMAKENGVSSIGYSKVPNHIVFRDKAILFDKAIVCTFEMDADKIALAPSLETNVMVMKAYDLLGRAVVKMAEFLRENGFASQAGHPLNGLALYPPMAASADLGIHGYQGLLITPEHGPRVRLAAVYTNIENLPFAQENSHQWIREYCDKCRRCIKKCPADAIYDEPEINLSNGLQTHIDNKKCFPYFLSDHSCTICIKVCPFSTNSYETLKNVWKEKIRSI